MHGLPRVAGRQPSATASPTLNLHAEVAVHAGERTRLELRATVPLLGSREVAEFGVEW